MRRANAGWTLVTIVAASMGAAGRGAYAGGPLYATTSGEAVRWETTAPVSYSVDQGALGVLSSAAAIAMTESLFSVWQDVPIATIEFARVGSLPVDVDASNFAAYLGPYAGFGVPLGTNAIVFDADGSIFDTLFGVGSGVLGFAGPTFFSDGVATVRLGAPIPPGSTIVEGLAFLNGKWIDGIDVPPNYEIPIDTFETVFVHEFGHFSGLDHTQIHGLQLPATADDIGVTLPIETMYPFVSDATQSTLERDDAVALAALYPEPSFVASTGRVTGRVLDANGTPLSGINVIAVNVADDSDAVSYVSGATLTPPGAYSLAGLTAGESYRIDIQAVDAFATGGSRVGPFSPPIAMPGPPESYNGTAESADPVLDDPTAFEPIVASAGVTVAGVDVTLNFQRFDVDNVRLEGDSQLQEFAVGDFDEDGIVDFIAPQLGFTPGNATRFYRGLGSGEFAAPVTIGNLMGNNYIAVGQFNAGVDSFLDIAVAGFSRGELRVHLGNGDGTFDAPLTLIDLPDFPPIEITGLQSADMNADGVADLFIIANNYSTDGATTHVFLGSPSGAFSEVSTSLPPGSTFPRGSFVLVDVVGSSAIDVVGVAGPAMLGILIGDGAGGFAISSSDVSSTSLSIDTRALAAGDFDADGGTDLVISTLYPTGGAPNFTRSFIDLLLGDGAGGFELADRYFVAESFQFAIDAVDLNGDGHLDIASAGATYDKGSPGAKVTIAFGDGTGGIADIQTVWGLAEFPAAIAVADLDGNSALDLLVSDSVASAFGLAPSPMFSVLLHSLCANGTLDAGEQCDDGNRIHGDGCDGNCTWTACGNGIVTGIEQCDDGNTASGDCCSAACQLDPVESSCTDDSDSCSRDTCDGNGICVHAYVPLTTCRTPERSVLKITNHFLSARDRLGWSWLRGEATNATEFGDPRITADYALCVFDADDGLIVNVTVPAGDTSWQRTSRGFKYDDRFGIQDGVQRLSLNSSSVDRASVVLRARGPSLPALDLGAFPSPVIAQLHNDDTSVCWEAVYEAADIVKSDGRTLRAALDSR